MGWERRRHQFKPRKASFAPFAETLVDSRSARFTSVGFAENVRLA
jgi:hypothetical protein